MERMAQNAAHGADVVRRTMQALPRARGCSCGSALETALVTPRELVPAETQQRLAPILEPHWGLQP
jgi:hypothetical protein